MSWVLFLYINIQIWRMQSIHDYIGLSFVGKTYHFKCDCLLALDVVGKVVGYAVHNMEIIFDVDVSGRIIQIGSNHPNLTIEEV